MSTYLICQNDLIFLISMPGRQLYIRCLRSRIFKELSLSDQYFEYSIGDKNKIANYLEKNIQKKPSCFDKTKYEKRDSSILSVNDMKQEIILLNKDCVIYTGAGISRAAGIFTQKELISFLYLDDLPKLYDILTKCPDILFSRYQLFLCTLLNTRITPAHNGVKKICERTGAALVSENLDRLHEISGIIPHNPFLEPELYNWTPKQVVLLGIGEPQCRDLLYSWFSGGAKFDLLNVSDPQISYLEYRICIADVQQFFCEMSL